MSAAMLSDAGAVATGCVGGGGASGALGAMGEPDVPIEAMAHQDALGLQVQAAAAEEASSLISASSAWDVAAIGGPGTQIRTKIQDKVEEILQRAGAVQR